ncbi:hypothetical protein ACWT_3245 [Actinoplanes sp. SE50]|nr:hypothetical protein ACPL_3373 [Actinoplanes sp. SE50/110]ATO82660.1 hypothetical protein ACWT_3245 [Actinoplanes sp. SE50]SLM00067.1 hypothetical protein ACSP50_3299 [Actinoplanes sp. SE50/110]
MTDLEFTGTSEGALETSRSSSRQPLASVNAGSVLSRDHLTMICQTGRRNARPVRQIRRYTSGTPRTPTAFKPKKRDSGDSFHHATAQLPAKNCGAGRLPAWVRTFVRMTFLAAFITADPNSFDSLDSSLDDHESEPETKTSASFTPRSTRARSRAATYRVLGPAKRPSACRTLGKTGNVRSSHSRTLRAFASAMEPTRGGSGVGHLKPSTSSRPGMMPRSEEIRISSSPGIMIRYKRLIKAIPSGSSTPDDRPTVDGTATCYQPRALWESCHRPMCRLY